jgi:hypothetical protein
VQDLNPNRARAVASVAYHFVYPLVASYCAMYHEAVDTSSPSFSGGFGAWRHVGVSEDRKLGVGRPREAVVRSSVWLDLRSEPWWFTVGEIPPEVRFTVQWVDLWGFGIERGTAAEHAPRPASVLVSAPMPVEDIPAEIDHVVTVNRASSHSGRRATGTTRTHSQE